MKRKLNILPIILLFFLVGCVGCANFSKNAYRTLSIQADTYESAKDMANAMPSDTWTPEEKAEIEKISQRYRIAYHSGVEAVIAYEENKDKQGKELVNSALEKLKEVVRIFSDYIRRW